MNKKVILLILSLSLSTVSLSQAVDSQIFKAVCQEIIKNEENYRIKEKLQGVYIIFEPVSGKDEVIISDTTNLKIRKYAGGLNKERLLSILKTEQFPIFPIKDTVCIIDTFDFFPYNFSLKNDHFFKVISSKDENSESKLAKNKSYIYLRRIGVRDGKIVLAFSFENSDKIFCCYFSLNGNISMFKSTVSENKFIY